MSLLYLTMNISILRAMPRQEVEQSKLAQRHKGLQAGVRHMGSRQDQVFQLSQPFEMRQSRIPDPGIAEVEGPELVQSLEMLQSRSRDARFSENRRLQL